MNSFLLLGDPHLGKGGSLAKQSVGSVFNSRVIDQFKLLDWVYEQALLHQMERIVITGDVFDDPKPHYSILALFIDWLRKCMDSQLEVHIIAGNHDILRSGQFVTSPLDVISAESLDRVFIYKKITTLHLEHMGITFLPFRDRRSLNTDSNAQAVKFLQNQIPYQVRTISDNVPKILIGHLALEGSIPVGYELDDLANELFCPLLMFNEYDYVWMGHVHKFQVLSEKPYISHIGSMDISDFGEVDHIKNIAIVRASPALTVEYVEIPTRKLNHICVDIPENTENITQFVLEEVKKHNQINDSIVKLSVSIPNSSSCILDRSLLERELYRAGVFHISRISEERKFVSLKKKIKENIDNSVNESSAIKTYSNLVEDHLREDFITAALSIIQEYKEALK